MPHNAHSPWGNGVSAVLQEPGEAPHAQHLSFSSVTMDEIDGIDHWASNTHCEVYAAKIPKLVSSMLAWLENDQALSTSTFRPWLLLQASNVGEAYHVPWAGVPVLDKLQTMLFPFVENVLTNLKAESHVNQGVINFLELLQQLCPFFWQVGEH